jgi:hypothetical protein
MTSPAQTAANRRNSKKSSGPRTAEGRARSSANALTHGCYATRTDAITAGILGEDLGEVETLLDAIVDELDPQTPLEQIAAETVACRILNRARVDRLTAPIAEGVAPIGGRSVDLDSAQFQYRLGVDLNTALDVLDGDSDHPVDWPWLIDRVRFIEPAGRGFDVTQTWPDGQTRPPLTVAEWKSTCARLLEQCFDDLANTRDAAVSKIALFKDLADAEERAVRAAQAQQLLEHFERTTHLGDRVDRSFTKALDTYRSIRANRLDPSTNEPAEA